MSKVSTFPPRGLAYFWFLNSDCRMEDLRPQIRKFGAAGVAAVVLHPRDGLLVPYMSKDFLDLIRTLVDELWAQGIQSWLYDEDYCPSGQGAGWVLADHPEFLARRVERFEAPAELKEGELFFFEKGMLLWAGVVGPDGCDKAVDLTDRVGIIRRHWEASEWDSRWYYPDTPLYPCPRSGAYLPEFALRMPKLAKGHKLVTFVATNAAPNSPYDGLVDPLNPAATQDFIDKIYVPYAKALGSRMGTKVTAIFTDEPKYHGVNPWTHDLFPRFQKQFGYDLRPRLEDLFSYPQSARAARTRLDYRVLVGKRFEDAWMVPIAKWCKKHNVKFVGHISPEDDFAQQAACIGNLFPLQKHFEIPGLDLIIPAVGDHEHAIVNVGVTLSTSSAQQQKKVGVMSEILGANGLDVSTRLAGKVLGWQIMQGVSIPVVHAAAASTLGLRKLDAPPNCGPNSERWDGMVDIDRGLRPVIDAVSDSTQVAPVAVLWPVRSINSITVPVFLREFPQRVAFNHLLLACFEAQVGTHLLDEGDLHHAKIDKGTLRIGKATYQTVLIRKATILHAQTLKKLAEFRKAGGKVYLCGDAPKLTDDGHTFVARKPSPWDVVVEQGDWIPWCRANLPRLTPTVESVSPWLRVTQWIKNGKTHSLMMNLGDNPQEATLVGGKVKIQGGEIVIATDPGQGLNITHRFDPNAVRANHPRPKLLSLSNWQARLDEESWRELKLPAPAYLLKPVFQDASRVVQMVLTGTAAPDGKPIATTLEYRAQLGEPNGSRHAVLVLEPTAQRGTFTITAGKRTWQTTMRDTDTKPVEIDLSPALADGARDLHFRVDQPMPYDGIKWPPDVVVRED